MLVGDGGSITGWVGGGGSWCSGPIGMVGVLEGTQFFCMPTLLCYYAKREYIVFITKIKPLQIKRKHSIVVCLNRII